MRLISCGLGKIKRVQCFLSLLLWLIFVSLGFYWFLIREDDLKTLTQNDYGQDSSLEAREIKWNEGKSMYNNYDAHVATESRKQDNDYETSINRLCNDVSSIKPVEENIQIPEFRIQAVTLVLRHGDRGPLNHIGHRNISHINCAARDDDFNELLKFSTDIISKSSGYSQFLGAFHSFPKVPSSAYCSLGQLSQQGSSQMLALGKMIRSLYKDFLANSTVPHVNHDQLTPLNVIAYSTRYRRTFQSLFAFLYGLLGPKQMIQGASIYESQSMSFCFKYCSCKLADRLKKFANKIKSSNKDKQAMQALVNDLNGLLGTEKIKKTGNSLLDSLLVYPCHNARLPCFEKANKGKGFQFILKTLKNLSAYGSRTPKPNSNACITEDQVTKLISLINKESHLLKNSAENKKYHLLNSYGLLREIVNTALKMTSSGPKQDTLTRRAQPVAWYASGLSSSTSHNEKIGSNLNSRTKNSKMVVFAGHDTTIQSLLAALGITSGHPDLNLPPFASRLIFEFYRRTNVPPNSPRKYYFRLIFNGHSIAHLISFCRVDGNKSKSETRIHQEYTTHHVEFCPIERLVRFLHDRYFDPFPNATNFKDACQQDNKV